MSATLGALLRHDLRQQWRNGIFLAYGFVIGFYVVVLVQFGAVLPDWLIGVIIYTDPAVVGFFFLGALIMLERGEGVHAALAVTPLRAMQYLAAKTVTLTLLSSIAVLVLAAMVHGAVNIPLLVTATALTSLTYLGFGVPAAFFFRTVTGYLIGAAGWLLPISAPAFIALIDPMPVWAIAIPTASQLRLVLVSLGFSKASAPEIFAMLAVSAGFAVAALWWGKARLTQEFGRK